MDLSEKQSLWSRNFIIINLCVMFASFTNFAFIYILPVHMLRIGGTNSRVGLMGAGLTIVGLVTRLTIAPKIDTWGRKPMLVLGGILFAVNALGYFLLRDSIPGIIVMRCFSGFSQGILFPVPPTIVSDISPKDKLVDGLGYFGIASSLPAIFSPVLGLYLYENIGSFAFFTVTLITSVISIVFGLMYKDVYVPQKKAKAVRTRFSLNSVLEVSILILCLVSFLAIFGFSPVNNFVILCGESRGIAAMSLFFTVHNIAIITTRLVAGKLRRFMNSKAIIVLGLMIIGGGTVLVAFAQNTVMMMIASAIMAIGGTLYSQYLQADILLSVPNERRGVANSTLMLAQDLGTGAGAATFGVVSENLGYTVTFIAAGFITWLAIPFNFIRSRMKNAA